MLDNLDLTNYPKVKNMSKMKEIEIYRNGFYTVKKLYYNFKYIFIVLYLTNYIVSFTDSNEAINYILNKKG